MPVISFCGESFTVDHAVKGADYVHGYDENSNLIVSLEGITDFSGISYDGEYMAPDSCLTERCNDVKYCGGSLKKRDGTELTPEDLGALPLSGGTVAGSVYINNTKDASSTADNAPALVIGNRAGEHIVFDGNEIIPKSGPTKGGTLYLGDSADTVISISGIFRLNAYSYGDELPDPGIPGRIFFKRVT